VEDSGGKVAGPNVQQDPRLANPDSTIKKLKSALLSRSKCIVQKKKKENCKHSSAHRRWKRKQP